MISLLLVSSLLAGAAAFL
ncbi:hypothetical protein M1D85_11340 [Bacillus sp. JZ35]|nr:MULTISPECIES: hypothetical protein [Bacillus]MCK8451903.1 hypothetical protein [Bacillus safensis]MCM2984563.1 hypothetical protein [Bacillus safensis]MCM3027757.1 hypothetical protein [Bacillus safensis]MCM3049181.1 hypothetical protein [Bacillus safensis]MCM3136977.1 hypothetical protein [Bacillus safensis]